MLLVLLGHRRGRARATAAVLVVWVVWVAFAAEEPTSLICSASGEKRIATSSGGGPVRIVTLNCSGGSATAADEVVKYDPDVVLLQESPSRREVERLARKLYGVRGHAVWGVDASVLSRWEVEALDVRRDASAFKAGARVGPIGGREFAVFSVRLAPPVFRPDLWSPGCWRAYARDRHARREQAAEAVAEARRLARGTPVVLGGDMNVPAGDGSLEPLRANLRDCFIDRGRGWGNTVLNEYPALRFDQIWASERFGVLSVTAHGTVNSDHRLVVCDLVLDR